MAIKIEDLRKRGTAKHEAKLLMKKLLHRGIPRVFDCRRDRERYVVVMELLGPSIFHLVRERRKKPSLDSLYRIMYQTLKILRFTHRKGYVHTDIKPDNVLLGAHAHSHRVYLIDFCEARKYASQTPAEYAGNPYFTSTAVLMGERYGPKDDLEALAYVFGFLYAGKLPWNDLYDIDPAVSIQKIVEFRGKNDLRSLWTDAPQVIVDLVDIARGLGSLEVPDYPAILSRLRLEAADLRINLKSKETIWDLTPRPQIKRLETVVFPLGKDVEMPADLLAKVRNADKPLDRFDSNALTVDSVSADPTIATIVTHKLPVVPDSLRNAQLN